ncbi:unnamed protein product [Calypogeia fissa]
MIYVTFQHQTAGENGIDPVTKSSEEPKREIHNLEGEAPEEASGVSPMMHEQHHPQASAPKDEEEMILAAGGEDTREDTGGGGRSAPPPSPTTPPGEEFKEVELRNPEKPTEKESAAAHEKHEKEKDEEDVPKNGCCGWTASIKRSIAASRRPKPSGSTATVPADTQTVSSAPNFTILPRGTQVPPGGTPSPIHN